MSVETASAKEIEMGISRFGSPTKATNELPQSVRINFCWTLESSKKKSQPPEGLVKKGALNCPPTIPHTPNWQ